MAKKPAVYDNQSREIIPLQTEAPAVAATVPFAALRQQNETYVSKSVRRIREAVADCQQRLGTGGIKITIAMNNGLMTGDTRVSTDWSERLT